MTLVLPYFISWVIDGYCIYGFLSTDTGVKRASFLSIWRTAQSSERIPDASFSYLRCSRPVPLSMHPWYPSARIFSPILNNGKRSTPDTRNTASGAAQTASFTIRRARRISSRQQNNNSRKNTAEHSALRRAFLYSFERSGKFTAYAPDPALHAVRLRSGCRRSSAEPE